MPESTTTHSKLCKVSSGSITEGDKWAVQAQRKTGGLGYSDLYCLWSTGFGEAHTHTYMETNC